MGTSEYQEDSDGLTNNRQCDLAHNGSSPTLINSKYWTTTTTGSRPLQRCTRNRIISPTSFFTVDRWFESGSNSHSACGLVFIDYMTAYINCEQLRHNPWQAIVANNHDWWSVCVDSVTNWAKNWPVDTRISFSSHGRRLLVWGWIGATPTSLHVDTYST